MVKCKLMRAQELWELGGLAAPRFTKYLCSAPPTSRARTGRSHDGRLMVDDLLENHFPSAVERQLSPLLQQLRSTSSPRFSLCDGIIVDFSLPFQSFVSKGRAVRRAAGAAIDVEAFTLLGRERCCNSTVGFTFRVGRVKVDLFGYSRGRRPRFSLHSDHHSVYSLQLEGRSNGMKDPPD